MTAFSGVTEAQGRGTLHLHFLAWSDLQPSVIREFVNDEEVMSAICNRLDSLVQAWIPPFGTGDFRRDCNNNIVEDVRDGQRISPLPTLDISAFTCRYVDVVQQMNISGARRVIFFSRTANRVVVFPIKYNCGIVWFISSDRALFSLYFDTINAE